MPPAERNALSSCTPSQGGTRLLSLLRDAVVASEGEEIFGSWYDQDGKLLDDFTFAGLWAAAGKVARDLRMTWGIERGERVLLCYSFGLNFFAAWLGCIRAGVLAVPVYPPDPSSLDKALTKMRRIADDCGAHVCLCDGPVHALRFSSRLNFLSRADWGSMEFRRTASAAGVPGAAISELSFDEPALKEEDVAFLQYTSGSTADPKGVIITHANLYHNVKLILAYHQRGASSDPAKVAHRRLGLVGASWLPQYHDMGLVVGTLAPFCGGYRMHYVSPVSFVRRPPVWIELLSRHAANWSVTPDFAFKLTARKFEQQREKAAGRSKSGRLGRSFAPAASSSAAHIDLSNLLFISSGAEALRTESARIFEDTFRPLGLRKHWFVGTYGLAEHVVCVSAMSMASAEEEQGGDDSVMACGSLQLLTEFGQPPVQMIIVNPQTCELISGGGVGELWLHSESVGQGYWGMPELSEETFRACVAGGDRSIRWLRTGDLASIDESGRIEIRGRLKELIIVRGVNVYPQDVEHAVQNSSSHVRAGRVAAWQCTRSGAVEIALEVKDDGGGRSGQAKALLQEALKAARAAASRALGAAPARVAIVAEKSLPKTTSGKIRRGAAREALQAGQMRVLAEIGGSVVESEDVLAKSSSSSSSDGCREEEENRRSFVAALEGGGSGSNGQVNGLRGEHGAAARVRVEQAAVEELSNETSSEQQSTTTESNGDELSPMASTGTPPARHFAQGIAGGEEEDQNDKDDSSADAEDAAAEALQLLLDPAQRMARLTEMVLAAVHEALADSGEEGEGNVLSGGAVTAEIDADQPLLDAGLDSIAAQELSERLVGRLGQGYRHLVTPTLVFECPTARLIAEHLHKGLFGSAPHLSTAGSRGGLRGANDSLQRNLASSEDSNDVAIVSMACRFPGGCDSPEAFWAMLCEGVDAVTAVPAARWAAAASSAQAATRGAFVEGAELFDNEMFSISAAEAKEMDPQQRLMLEVGYEALCRAGLDRAALDGGAAAHTGVFVGACTADWSVMAARAASAAGTDAVGPYSSTGGAAAMLSNRLSFCLGLGGPSMTVDTACSSSLVALHAAVAALRRGECSVAVSGGVGLMLSPLPAELFARTGMLARDGRCKAFDAAADGYVRGEGCGAVVLKRLCDAVAAGDEVLAVVKGVAVAHNGRAATLTAPNSASQRRVIRQALVEAAGPGHSSAEDVAARVAFVEAHGTGTALGDAVELTALRDVYGSSACGRSADRALVLGAVKTNIGHLEGAAGIAGLLKAVLVLQNGAAPPNLHLHECNPKVDLSDLPLVLPPPGRLTPLVQGNGRCGDDNTLAAVSSFGFGGAISHAVLGLPSGEALAASEAAREARAEAGSEGAASASVRPPVAFLFTGQGSQYPGMGKGLYDTQPVFRDVVDRCDEVLAGLLPQRLLSVLYPEEGDASAAAAARAALSSTEYAQPALYAVEVALATLLASEGIFPSAVMGHSVGEVAAAAVAGYLSLEDGARMVAERALAMAAAPAPNGGGKMLAVTASAEAALRALTAAGRAAEGVSLAAVNGPQATVLSGPAAAVEAAVAILRASLPPSERESFRTRDLDVSNAFHSPAMRPAAQRIRQAAADAAFAVHAPVPLVSNVTGAVATPGELARPQHWEDHALGCVRFSDGVQTLANVAAGGGCSVFVEIGPSPVLTAMARRCLPEEGQRRRLAFLSLLSPDADKGGDARTFAKALGRLRSNVVFRRASFPWPMPPPAFSASACGTAALSQLPAIATGQELPQPCLLELQWEEVARPECGATTENSVSGSAAGSAGGAASSEGGCSESWLVVGCALDDPSFVAMSDAVDADENSSAHVAVFEDDGEAAAERLSSLLDSARRTGVAIDHVVYVLRAPSPATRAAAVAAGDAVLEGWDHELRRFRSFWRAFVGARGGSRRSSCARGAAGASVWVVTAGVVATEANDGVPGWVNGWVPGLVRSLRLEHPETLISHVDLPWPRSIGSEQTIALPLESTATNGFSSGASSSNGSSSNGCAGAKPHKNGNGKSSGNGKSNGNGVHKAAEAAAAAPSVAAAQAFVGRLRCGSAAVLGGEDVCVREGRVLVARLAESAVPLPSSAGQQRSGSSQGSGGGSGLSRVVSSEGTYIVSGGTSGIALTVAAELAACGARHIALLSRRDPASAAAAAAASCASAWAALRASEASVEFVRCDVTALPDVRAVIRGLASRGWPAVRGVVHAANASSLGGAASAPFSAGNLEVKAAGAWNLYIALRDVSNKTAGRNSGGGAGLDFFCVTSSVSSLVGIAGPRADYAASNSVVDAFVAHLRAAAGVNAVSVQFGPWTEAGTALTLAEAAKAAVRGIGHLGVTNSAGLAALAAALGSAGASSGSFVTAAASSAPAALAFAPADWDAYVSLFPTSRPLLSRLLRAEGSEGSSSKPSGSSLPSSVEEATAVILAAAAEVMGSGGAALTATTDLREEGGMDSLEALEFRRVLLSRLGLRGAAVPTTLLHDCPTPQAMAERLFRARSADDIRGASASSAAPPAFDGGPAAASKAPLVSAADAATVFGAQALGGGAAARLESEVDEEAAVWVEEQHLDNPLFLLCNLLVGLLAYLYIAAAVMLPGWVFFRAVAWAFADDVSPSSGPAMLYLWRLVSGSNSSGSSKAFLLVLKALAVVPALWIAYGFVLCLVVVASKWLLIGRLLPGTSFARHSWLGLRWRVVQRLMSFAGILFVDEVRRTRFIVWYYRALGCRIGRDVFLNSNRIHDPDMIALGDGVTVNEHALLKGHSLSGNVVTLGPVSIGAATVVLPSAMLGGRSGASVDVPAGRIVDSLCTEAHPTRRNTFAAATLAGIAARKPLARVVRELWACASDAFGLWVVAAVVVLAAFPAFHLLSYLLAAQGVCPPPELDDARSALRLSDSGAAFAAFAGIFLVSRLYLPLAPVFCAAPPALALACARAALASPAAAVTAALSLGVCAAFCALLLMALSIAAKWALVGRLRPTSSTSSSSGSRSGSLGGESALSLSGVAKQASDRVIMSAMMRAVLMFNGGFGNALWLRLLGCRIGARVTVMLNKNIYCEAELLELGDDVHIGFASNTYCCLWLAPHRYSLERVAVGARALVGAGSVTLPGSTIPASAALGPNTRLTSRDAMREHALHVGQPGAPSPVAVAAYKPPPRLLSPYEQFLYFAAPVPLAAMAMAVIALAALPAVYAAASLASSYGVWRACFTSPALYLLFGLSLALASAAVKWVAVGQQRPGVVRLWSPYHHRTLLVLVVQAAAHFLFVDLLRAGSLYAWYCRLMGATVGRDAVLDTCYLTDHDLLTVGERATLHEECVPHPQFYFQGDMALANVAIEADAVVGARAVVLGGAKCGGTVEAFGLRSRKATAVTAATTAAAAAASRKAPASAGLER